MNFPTQTALLVLLSHLASVAASAQKESPTTGPESEQRFPPLKIPAGFKATLFACDPLIEYPSAIALGPRPASVFAAIDYMTGLGTEIIRRDEIRIVEDTNGDGYADRAIVYAGGFNSIQGLTFHDGTLYVMHAPFLTALRDLDGDGKADERHDLLTGLGLTPEENPVRLHCANGLVMGHDGWLYLALGDHGCSVARPEGDRLELHGGGILRCRPDGHDLHVFAKGLRNIYDVALDDELNVFVRDNENDGGDYKIRVCHSFFGADHGYPYLYHERPQEALAPLADLGLGSSAGGLCYLENNFPTEFRGNLFFCEWGRSVVRYPLQRAQSGFAPVKELEFAAASENDPYGFKPTDLIVDRDGALFVADWADGQRPKRGRGRIYRISYSGNPGQSHSSFSGGAPPHPSAEVMTLESALKNLDSESHYERIEAQIAIERRGREGMNRLLAGLPQERLGPRARLHAIWILAHKGGPSSLDELLALAETNSDARVRVQAMRAIADLADPMLAQHRLDAGPGDAKFAERLARFALKESDPRVNLEVIVALGRLRWAGAPDWFRNLPTPLDPPQSHAAMQTLRRSGNWPATLKLLDERENQPIRFVAMRAIADQFQTNLAEGLIERMRVEADPSRRFEYADLLTRVHRKPSRWVYWGYRPPPRPANTIAWEKTDAIENALDEMLADPMQTIRLAVLQRMQRENIPTRAATLNQWLNEEKNTECVGAILKSMRAQPSNLVRDSLEHVVAERAQALTNRLSALMHFDTGLDAASEGRLGELAHTIEDGPVMADTIRRLAKRHQLAASSLLVAKLNSSEPVVRAAAIDAVAQLRISEAIERVPRLLQDGDPAVRLAAVSAIGSLRIRSAIPPLLELARESAPAIRRASLNSLRLLEEPRAIPLAVAALSDRETQLSALQCLQDLGGPAQLTNVVSLARRDPSTEVLSSVIHLITKWSEAAPAHRNELDDAVAEVQGATGTLLRWSTAGLAQAKKTAAIIREEFFRGNISIEPNSIEPRWQSVFASGPEARVAFGPSKTTNGESAWIATANLRMPESIAAQFIGSSKGLARIWLNGRAAFPPGENNYLALDSQRFEADLNAGLNRVLIEITSTNPPEFSLKIRRKSSVEEHERLTQAALSRLGNVERGRKLFFAVERSQCLKCHQLAGQGERIGPELTGIGGRFSRIYIIESVLEPSRAIAPSFQSTEFLMNNGQEISGIVTADADGQITIADNQGQRRKISKSEVSRQRPQTLSVMPEGLEKGFTPEEFTDLIAFLASQKVNASR